MVCSDCCLIFQCVQQLLLARSELVPMPTHPHDDFMRVFCMPTSHVIDDSEQGLCPSPMALHLDVQDRLDISDVSARLGLKAGAWARLRRAWASCLLKLGHLIGLRLGSGLAQGLEGPGPGPIMYSTRECK